MKIMKWLKIIGFIIILILSAILLPNIITVIFKIVNCISIKINMPIGFLLDNTYTIKINELCNIVTSFVFGISSLLISYTAYSLTRKTTENKKAKERENENYNFSLLKKEIESNLSLIESCLNKTSETNSIISIQTDVFEKNFNCRTMFSKKDLKSLTNLYDYFNNVKNNNICSIDHSSYFIDKGCMYEINKNNEIIKTINEMERSANYE